MKKLFLALCVMTSFSVFSSDIDMRGLDDSRREIIIKQMQQIVLKAQEKHPDDYTMQAFEVNNQIKSMVEMEKLCKTMKIYEPKS